MNHEQERINELLAYKIMDSPQEKILDEFTQIASVLCDVPMAIIGFIDQERQWYKSHTGMGDKTEVPRNITFCQYTLDKPDEVMIVEDSKLDDRFKNNPLVSIDSGIRFYAGAPLTTPNGHVLGTLCVLDTEAKKITEKQKTALALLAQRVMDHLNHRKLILDQSENIKSNAAKLKLLTDQSPGVIYQFEMNPAGEISFPFISEGIAELHPELNPEILRMYPNKVFDVMHPDDLPRIQDQIRESFETLCDWNCEYRVITSKGEIEWHMGKSRPHKNADGTVVWYGTIQNVTHHHEYLQAMEQIMFDISHILRKPVTTLMSLSSIINEEIDEKTIKSLSQMISSVSNELDLVTRKLNESYGKKQHIILHGRNR